MCSLSDKYLIKGSYKSRINGKICSPSRFMVWMGFWHMLDNFCFGYFLAGYQFLLFPFVSSTQFYQNSTYSGKKKVDVSLQSLWCISSALYFQEKSRSSSFKGTHFPAIRTIQPSRRGGDCPRGIQMPWSYHGGN